MSKEMKSCVSIGTSGWNYGHWRSVFYPPECPKTKWLQFYAGEFTTVEVNATFYRLPPQATFENWKRNTPEGFLWAVKANRYITHVKRLQDPDESLGRFFRAARSLGEKLGPVLFQLPPALAYNRDVFSRFCETLDKYRHRCALEIRHKSWLEERVLATLETHGIAFCISDTAGRYPYSEAVTADFIYIRLHGSRKLYVSDYTEEELQAWAEKITRWGRDTYVYFDNDFAGHAPGNAASLKRILGVR
ncbi:MAG: DUF72 domain-containing protein [Deltaproteobacteria bacterium]|nr:DUF72 domain-containing protein [Deltaproteobacteria bacterium]